MKKSSTTTKKVLFLAVFAIALSLAFLPMMANASAFTDFPIAVDGRILSVDQTGDIANWIEIARYGEYSLIVRQQFINRTNMYGYTYGDPKWQGVPFGATDSYNTSNPRTLINDWFNNRTTLIQSGPLGGDHLAPDARIRNFTVQHDAMFKFGTTCQQVSLTDGLSKPTHYQVGFGNDIAFALSYSEAANFISQTHFMRGVYIANQPSSYLARANYDKLNMPKVQGWYTGMWLRTPGDSKPSAGTITHDARVFQMSLSGSNFAITAFPALWVGSGIFQSSATINVVCRDIMDQNVIRSDSYKVPAGTYGPYIPPVIPGYTLINIANNSAPVSGTIREGETITITFLYMKSGAIVTYMPNGGTGQIRLYDATIGGTHTVTDQGYTHASQVFTGWNTVSDGSGISYSNGQAILVNGDITLYAQWRTAQSYMLIYSPNGGMGNIVVEMTDNSGRITIRNQNYFRDAHVFTGWNTMPDGSGVFYLTGQSITLNNTMVLYAQWERTTNYYSITYLPGTGGVGGSVDSGLADGWRYNIKNPMAAGVSKPWAAFDKWNTEIDGSGISYVPGQSITVFGNLTLYAIWFD